jgi:hypothetical protein
MDTINSFEICPKFEIQTYPAITFDGQNYIVVWSDNNFGGSYYYVAAARVTPDGVVLDTGACISNGTGSSEYRAKIAYDGNRSLVVWPKSSGPIYGRFINSQCQPEGNMFVIASAPAGGPNIAFDGTNYLVVWYSGSYPSLELYGQLVSTQGALVGSPISIALGAGCHRWADISFDGTKYLVIWQTGENNAGQKIYGQFIGTDGAHIGGTLMICDNTYEQRWWPAIAAADSNFIAVWGQGYGSACNIWGNVDVTITGVNEAREYTIHDTGLILDAKPNPFSQYTEIRITIRDQGYMEQELRSSNFEMQKHALRICDAAGRLVKNLLLPTTYYLPPTVVSWDGTDQANRKLGSGVYFARLEVGDRIVAEKVLLIR